MIGEPATFYQPSTIQKVLRWHSPLETSFEIPNLPETILDHPIPTYCDNPIPATEDVASASSPATSLGPPYKKEAYLRSTKEHQPTSLSFGGTTNPSQIPFYSPQESYIKYPLPSNPSNPVKSISFDAIPTSPPNYSSQSSQFYSNPQCSVNLNAPIYNANSRSQTSNVQPNHFTMFAMPPQSHDIFNNGNVSNSLYRDQSFNQSLPHSSNSFGPFSEGSFSEYPNHVQANSNLFPSRHAERSSSSLEVFSRNLLQQDLLKKTIEPFDGRAVNFWTWYSKITSYSKDLLLSPLQTLQLFENHCRGKPQRMLNNKLAALGEVTPEDARQAIDSLIIRFGSTQRITFELFSKVDSFPVIKGADIGNQLHNLHELSHSSHCFGDVGICD